MEQRRLNISLTFIDAPNVLQVIECKGHLVENIIWRSPARYQSPVTYIKRFPLFSLTGKYGAPYCVVPAHTSTSLSASVRLPHDEEMVPSTCFGTSTPLDISHEVEVKVTYATEGGREMTITIRKEVEVATVRPVAAAAASLTSSDTVSQH